MSKEKESTSLRKIFFQNLFVIAGIVVAILNLWLVTKLAPMAQDIALIKQEVQAMEDNQKNFVTIGEINSINGRLDRMQTSLNDLVKIHLGNK